MLAWLAVGFGVGRATAPGANVTSYNGTTYDYPFRGMALT